MNEQTLKQLEHLFPDTVNIWTGDKYTLLEPENSEFFCINPLKNFDNRQNENVLEKRNFLIEFDEGSLEDQKASISTIESSGLKIASAVYSGSKSIHLIFSMAENLTVDYRSAWLALSMECASLTGLNADPACKNEARLSRLAGIVRADTGLSQELLHLGGFLTNAKVLELINKHQIRTSINNEDVVPLNDMNLTKFKFAIQKHKGLWSKLRSAPIWAKPVNMYPELLKLTIWAVEKTGVPKETFLQYSQENIFPYLVQVGYPTDKLDKAIHNAYDYLS